MTAVTTVREVLWQASTLLEDINSQFNRYDEHSLVEYLNDGQIAIAKFVPTMCSGIYSVKLRAGTVQSVDAIATTDCKLDDGGTPANPVRGLQVVDFYNHMGVDGLTPGAALPRPVDRRILDTATPMWHATPGTLVNEVSFDPLLPTKFLAKPAVPTAGPGAVQWLRLALVVKPDRVPNTGTAVAPRYHFAGSDATVISIDDAAKDELVDYIVARAAMLRTDLEMSDMAAKFTARFVGAINAQALAATGVNPNLQRLPMVTQPPGSAK